MRRAAGASRYWLYGAALVVVAAANATVAGGLYVPFLCPLLGFMAAVVVPAYFVFKLLGRWWWREVGERLVVAVAVTLLLLVVVELILDLVLPHLGVTRPLDRWPVLLAGDAIDLAVGALALPYVPRRLGRLTPPGYRAWLCISRGTVDPRRSERGSAGDPG